MTFFEFLKFFFTNTDDAMSLDKTEIERHAFMLNRMMSIKYPEHAAHLSKFGFSAFVVVAYWSDVAKKYNTYPKFLYTKMDKAPDQKEILEFLNYMKLDTWTKEYILRDCTIVENDVQDFQEMKKINKSK